MSAVLKQQAATPGITIPGDSAHNDLLTPAAQVFLAGLHQRFETRRQALLASRATRQARFDAGELPDFRADIRAIREGDWRVAGTPAALRDRRVEITGPVEGPVGECIGADQYPGQGR